MNRTGTVVAATLGGVLLLSVVAVAVLAGLDRPVPGIIENLASGALGALAALLARVGTDDVRVVNSGPGEAVPVIEKDAGHADIVTVLAAAVLVVILLVLLGVL